MWRCKISAGKTSAIVALFLSFFILPNSVQAGPPSATFEWKGRFSAGSPSCRPSWPQADWIEGGWDVNVKTKLEFDTPTIPGVQIPLTIRYYSIKSVSIKIPFQYFVFPLADCMRCPLIEDYLVVLDSSDFDLTYPPNFSGIPKPGTQYNGSWVYETYDFPTAGAYQYQIFLKFKGPKVLVTPKGATLTLGAGGVGSLGGFFISHLSYAPEAPSFWPDGSDFVAPSAYQPCVYAYIASPNPKDFRAFCSPRETDSIYKTVRFLDEENKNRRVVGAVADGRSRVIVELRDVQSSASVTKPDGDGTWVSEPTLQNGVWRRTWQAPESFGGSENNNIQGRRPISFDIVIDGQSITPPRFHLYKAPVVLLHGIWSDASIWFPLQNALQSDGFRAYAWSYPPQASFLENKMVTQNHINRALTQVRDMGLVAKKADIVAHSMGGCLAKMDVSNKDYIRRIVTIGTPHYGSEVADLFYYHPLGLGKALLKLIGRTAEGALYDLTTSRCRSYDIYGNRLGIPVLAINGIVTPSNSFPEFSDAAAYLATLRFLLAEKGSQQQLHEDLFGTDTSDWVVSGTSQMGGLLGDSVQNVPVTWHVDEPLNSDFIDYTIDFLDAPTGSVSATIAQQESPLAEAQPIFAQPLIREVEGKALASGGVTITAPAASTVYSPGDTVHVAVSAPPAATQVLVALSDGSVVTDNASPFEMDIPIPQQAIGVTKIGALAWDTNGIIGTASTAVTVTTAATITSLKVWPDSVLYLNKGDTVPFVVHGVFSDGIERDITGSECHTTYKTTDMAVASISTAGVLTAKAPGYCSVVVSNGESMQIPVLVQTPSPPAIAVTKCTIAAGSKASSDKISISGQMGTAADDFNDANVIKVTVDSNDIVNPAVLKFPIDANTFKKGKYSYSKTVNGIKKSFTYDVKTHKFAFSASNLDLSGLGCPVTIKIEIGNFIATAEIDEAIVNGPKVPIPIQLMTGVKNVLRVDKCTVKQNNKKANSDQLSVKGAFAVENTDVNMVNENLVVTLGTQTFTLPTGSFKAGKGKFTCTKATVTEGGIAAANFNFNTCSFTLTIKNTVNITATGTVDFGVAFAGYDEVVQVTLP